MLGKGTRLAPQGLGPSLPTITPRTAQPAAEKQSRTVDALLPRLFVVPPLFERLLTVAAPISRP